MRYLLLLSLLLLPIPTLAWDDCPHGLTNDPYPGDCARYIDTDSNGICDHSEPAPANRDTEVMTLPVTATTQNSVDVHDIITGRDLKTKRVNEVAKLYNISATAYAAALSKSIGATVRTTDSFQDLHDQYGLAPSDAKSIAEQLITNGAVTTAASVKSLTVETNSTAAAYQTNKRKPPYHVWQIILVSTLLYLGTWLTSKKKKITLATHRMIWNIFLLSSFLFTTFTSIVLVLRLNYGWFSSSTFNFVFWHIEIGLFMIMIAIFHAIWHAPYFQGLVKRLNKPSKS